MTSHMDRRSFLKSTGILGCRNHAGRPGRFQLDGCRSGRRRAKREETWLASRMQAWTFNQTTLFEAIDNTASLGLHYIEAMPGQKLSKD